MRSWIVAGIHRGSESDSEEANQKLQTDSLSATAELGVSGREFVMSQKDPNEIGDGKTMLQDPTGESRTPGEPAFLSRPEGAPVYHGFPLVEETRTDGWCFGAITAFEDPDGCDCGDGFVVAPDGSRAGLVWEVGESPVGEICAPDDSRWGVYAVSFPKVVRTVEDLAECFRSVLPELQRIHREVTCSAG